MTDWAPRISRLSAGPKYYYVDYGISAFIPPGSSERLVTGTYGRDRDVPELSDDVPYDPFKVDIFILGNMFRQELYEKYGNLGFMLPIIEAMTQYDPEERPSAQQALDQWRTIRRKTWMFKKHWRTSYINEPILVTIILDVLGLIRIGIYLTKWLSGHRYPGP
ncbi:hypothetical protein EWM64_g6350 [Hericium alpestre]|uniref:Protein kinase domain-containing protein n=1 Tax=Hericium alpestre TaxID=135208 RepID=A0A4Y9ZS99_9AGAM|nr:hypothetical protein EWM64_g6350 [Hericium alpestre]